MGRPADIDEEKRKYKEGVTYHSTWYWGPLRPRFHSGADAYFKWYATNEWLNSFLSITPDDGKLEVDFNANTAKGYMLLRMSGIGLEDYYKFQEVSITEVGDKMYLGGSTLASNNGDGGRVLSVADDMLFHFSLTSSFISGVAKSVKELSPVAKRAFGRTSKTLGAIDLAITFQLARADGMTTWGESAQIGVNALIYLGTYNQYTLLPSIGFGIAEEYGAFDNWYSNWDEAHTLYNNYGVTILPITNPITHTPIIIKRRQ